MKNYYVNPIPIALSKSVWSISTVSIILILFISGVGNPNYFNESISIVFWLFIISSSLRMILSVIRRPLLVSLNEDKIIYSSLMDVDNKDGNGKFLNYLLFGITDKYLKHELSLDEIHSCKFHIDNKTKHLILLLNNNETRTLKLNMMTPKDIENLKTTLQKKDD